jgi:hypothetical protein
MHALTIAEVLVFTSVAEQDVQHRVSGCGGGGVKYKALCESTHTHNSCTVKGFKSINTICCDHYSTSSRMKMHTNINYTRKLRKFICTYIIRYAYIIISFCTCT